MSETNAAYADTFIRTFPEHSCRPLCRPPVHVTCINSYQPTVDFDEMRALLMEGEVMGEAVPTSVCGICRECATEEGWTVQSHYSAPVWFACDLVADTT